MAAHYSIVVLLSNNEMLEFIGVFEPSITFYTHWLSIILVGRNFIIRILKGVFSSDERE
jgi:hypothetical protein